MDEFVFNASSLIDDDDEVNLKLTLEINLDKEIKGINQIFFKNTLEVIRQEENKLDSCLNYSYDELMNDIQKHTNV